MRLFLKQFGKKGDFESARSIYDYHEYTKEQARKESCFSKCRWTVQDFANAAQLEILEAPKKGEGFGGCLVASTPSPESSWIETFRFTKDCPALNIPWRLPCTTSLVAALVLSDRSDPRYQVVLTRIACRFLSLLFRQMLMRLLYKGHRIWYQLSAHLAIYNLQLGGPERFWKFLDFLEVLLFRHFLWLL